MSGRPRVAILGGGMAGLTAAWELSRPGWHDELESITVYQRGWRVGGKGASSRGRDGRIEEHGLHVWLGYYDNAFRVMRECYAELDRDRTDPACPIRSWHDAFAPSAPVGVMDHRGPATPWLAWFSPNDGVPGVDAAPPLTPLRFVRQALAVAADGLRSLAGPPVDDGPLLISARSRPGPAVGPGIVRVLEAGVLAGTLELASLAASTLAAAGTQDPISREVLGWLDGARREVARLIEARPAAARLAELIDLLLTSVRGAVADGLLDGPIGFPAIDHLDVREWLARHGARPATLASPILRGLYDLVFGYEGGDRRRPAMSAGLGLFLAGKLFFDYRGALFWKMQAGMGDVVFAPLYEALARRGVRFELLHRLDRLALDGAGSSVTEIHLTRQASLTPGRTAYEPLVRVGGLPCFPDAPLADQLSLAPGASPPGPELERHGADGPGAGPVVLRAGEDFDVAVLAVSLGMVPHVAAELVERLPAWQAMVEGVATVPTRALQVWLTASETDLGGPPAGATVSGFEATFDTYASMTHLLAVEEWPDADRPRAVGYFCSALDDRPGESPATAATRVRDDARRFLADEAHRLLPGLRSAGGEVRWELLAGAGGAVGPARLEAQHVVASVDPSDRYVQSLPGSGRWRLLADGSGLSNLVLAGDWIDAGLNAGCIEAATLSGVQAANAVRGRPRWDGVLGTWPGGDARVGEDRAHR